MNNIQSLIAELTSDSITYHTEKRCKGLEETITAKASLLSKRIQIAVKHLGSNHDKKINSYKDALMKNNFAGEHRPEQDDDSELLKTIRNEGKHLSLELENSYSSKYHNHFSLLGLVKKIKGSFFKPKLFNK